MADKREAKLARGGLAVIARPARVVLPKPEPADTRDAVLTPPPPPFPCAAALRISTDDGVLCDIRSLTRVRVGAPAVLRAILRAVRQAGVEARLCMDSAGAGAGGSAGARTSMGAGASMGVGAAGLVRAWLRMRAWGAATAGVQQMRARARVRARVGVGAGTMRVMGASIRAQRVHCWRVHWARPVREWHVRCGCGATDAGIGDSETGVALSAARQGRAGAVLHAGREILHERGQEEEVAPRIRLQRSCGHGCQLDGCICGGCERGKRECGGSVAGASGGCQSGSQIGLKPPCAAALRSPMGVVKEIAGCGEWKESQVKFRAESALRMSRERAQAWGSD
ncbi:hypothetical protein GGX14DRAFT_392339 [Mycena pura]|uniref:Uncharacterized protein n=1 Tax=Mycena pura TaxID=153505 RepID=A0AAD6YJG2_9AGAR|nr:hypothetical protein GGX14DRAFT_392339 [Mycena pura]